MAAYIGQGFALGLGAIVFAWGMTIPVRWLFKFLGM